MAGFPFAEDGRIKPRDLEIGPIRESSAVLFHLDNQQLHTLDMANASTQSSTTSTEP